MSARPAGGLQADRAAECASRAVEDGAAYTAIAQAYADLKSELEQAAAAQLGVPSAGS